MTHKELVKLAKTYLAKIEKCSLVLAEKRSDSPEVPDAIGWKGRRSILIECKTSLQDFRHDKDKWFRIKNGGMGQQRYFLAPLGLIPPEELPEEWGLIEIYKKKFKITRKSSILYIDERRSFEELPLLLNTVRRLQYQNYLLRKRLR